MSSIRVFVELIVVVIALGIIIIIIIIIVVVSLIVVIGVVAIAFLVFFKRFFIKTDWISGGMIVIVIQVGLLLGRKRFIGFDAAI